MHLGYVNCTDRDQAADCNATIARAGSRGAVGVHGREPLLVVALVKHLQSALQLRHGLEVLHPEKLLLEGADETVGRPIALGLVSCF